MRTHRAPLAAAATVLTALTLAACGGSSGGATDATGAPPGIVTAPSTTSVSEAVGTAAPVTTDGPAATTPATPAPEITDGTSEPSTSEPAAGISPVAGDAALAEVLAAHLATIGDGSAPTAFGIATIDGDEIATAVAGKVSVDDPTPIALDARFHLGSDTKAMTAVTLASVLGERGFALSATLAEVLADVTPAVELDPGFAAVTVAQLLAHRSGIVEDELTLDEAALASMPPVEGRDAGARQILAAPQQDPGRPFSYSNSGFAIAGWISEQLTGRPWEDLVRERVFDPLGMTCGFGSPDGAAEPIGHDEAGIPDDRVDPIPALIDPAGRVACSMADWAAWARAALDLAMGRPSPLLPDDMAAQLFDVPDGGEYVSGWLVLPGPDGAVAYAHDGSNLHWLARIILVPAEDRALLIAANAAGDAVAAAFDDLVVTLLDV